MHTPSMPPGWYVDPDDPDLLRRWDGQAWTDDWELPAEVGRTTRTWPWALVCGGVVLLALLIGLGAVAFIYLRPAAAQQAELTVAQLSPMAQDACEQAVRAGSGDPDSAYFSRMRITAPSTTSGTWRINGSVESAATEGGTRSTMMVRCTVVWDADDREMTVTYASP